MKMIDPEQLQAFSRVLRGLGVLFMKVAGQQSTAHETFSKQELLALGVLGVRGSCRMGEIAEHLGVGQSAITPLVDRLEVQRVAQRVRSEADRRVWLVALTKKGERVVAQENEVYQRVAEEMLSPLSAPERETLIGLLERVGAGVAEV